MTLLSAYFWLILIKKYYLSSLSFTLILPFTWQVNNSNRCFSWRHVFPRQISLHVWTSIVLVHYIINLLFVLVSKIFMQLYLSAYLFFGINAFCVLSDIFTVDPFEWLVMGLLFRAMSIFDVSLGYYFIKYLVYHIYTH